MARRQHDPGPTDVGLGCFFGGLCSCSTLPRSAWGSHLSITFTGRPHIALSRRSSARSRMDFPGKERHGADIQSKCLQGHRGQLFGAAAWFGPKHLVAHRKREKGEGPARNPLPSAVPGSSHRDRECSEQHPGRTSQGSSCFGWRTSAPPDSCPLPSGFSCQHPVQGNGGPANLGHRAGTCPIEGAERWSQWVSLRRRASCRSEKRHLPATRPNVKQMAAHTPLTPHDSQAPPFFSKPELLIFFFCIFNIRIR